MIHTAVSLFHDPRLNKGTAFTEAERDAWHLRGLLPPRVLTQDQQVEKVLENFRSKFNPVFGIEANNFCALPRVQEAATAATRRFRE